MDWFSIAVIVLACIGALFVLGCIVVVVWAMIDSRNGAPNYPNPHVKSIAEQRQEEAFQFLDNEIRGSIRRNLNHRLPNGYPTSEPTLKARVDEIEKHLGITVYVKAAQPEKVVVKKGIKNESK